MNVTRIWDPDTLKPLHVVMIVITTAALAGSFLFLSVAESPGPVDGAIEWQPNSPLRALVSALCLNYEFPTFHADAVKSLVFALATGLALLVTGIAVSRGGAPGQERTDADIIKGGNDESVGKAESARRQIAPLVAAQIIAGIYLLWSLVSSGWSNALGLALGGTALLAIQFLWAFSLGNTMNRAAARTAAYVFLAVTAVCALIAIWYIQVRNPTLRAKFPFGNPLFLSTCLIPGLLIGLSVVYGVVARLATPGAMRRLPALMLALAGIVLGGWAFYLARSRGPAAGLVLGVLALFFFVLPRGRRWIAVVIGLLLVLAGWRMYTGMASAPSPTGRDATLRLRGYAWSYAMRMFEEHPLRGHGQGGFALVGDSYAAEKREGDPLGQSDVEMDPLALGARLDHAHNEWLEVLADLGSVGFVLIACVLLLTLLAGTATLDEPMDPGHRAALMGLMASLVGVCVAECFGVGLRLGAVPVVFFTALGLIWAMSRSPMSDLVGALSTRRVGRSVFLVASILAAIGILALARADWAAARNSYEASRLVHEQKYEQAMELLTRPQRQLNPARALRDLRRLSNAYRLKSRDLQLRYFDRINRAVQADPPDPNLWNLAGADRNVSLAYHGLSAKTYMDLVTYSPGYVDSGWIEYWLNRILLEYAAADGNEPSATNYLQGMADALKRELSRQPYNMNVTLEYLRTAGAALDMRTILVTLAKPLRHEPVSNASAEFAIMVADRPEFGPAFSSILPKAASIAEQTYIPAPTDAVAQWAPEILRIAGVIRFARGDYAAAEEALALAASAYDKMSLVAGAPMGVAGCLVKLAEARFMVSPQDPSLAMETLERANATAPDSEQGRRFVDGNRRGILTVYHLASGDEAAAAEILRGDDESVPVETVNSRLSAAYTDLCYRLIHRPGAEMPEACAGWLKRAGELDPRNANVYSLSADLAYRMEDYEGTVRYLRLALRAGVSPQRVVQFLAHARQRQPLFKPFDELWDELVPEEAAPKTKPPAPSGAADESPEQEGLPEEPGPDAVAPPETGKPDDSATQSGAATEEPPDSHPLP